MSVADDSEQVLADGARGKGRWTMNRYLVLVLSGAAATLALALLPGCAVNQVTANTPTATPTFTPFWLPTATPTSANSGCTYTQGYWKNHASAWPVSSLSLGSVSYNQAQLLSILGQSVQGNGLVSLAHQLIAAKLNVANGASGSAVAGTIASADSTIGALVVPPVGSGSLSPSSVASMVQALDDYNSGVTGPGHCGDQTGP